MIRRRKNLGPGFSEEVVKVTGKTGHFQKGDSPDWTDALLPHFKPSSEEGMQKSPWRIIFFAGISLVSFFIIFLRLFNLQIIHGKANRGLADGNRIQVKIIHAPRGIIFDRNGKILAANSPAFRLTNPSSGNHKSKLVSRQQALEWEVKDDPRFLNLEVDNVRAYPGGEKFAHVVGYMGEISEEQLKKKEFKNYRAGDQIGQYGIEAQYENTLKGVDGGEIFEVDSKGRKIRILRMEEPIPGQNIYLSLDASLQEKLYDSIKDTVLKVNSCCAAAVAEDPATGKILALVSLPAFDPNLFSKNDTDAAISEVFNNQSAPILNRVIGGTYPPGSTFKIVSSLAAISSGKVKAETSFEDTGIMYLGPYSFTNWYFNQYGKTEGSVNLVKALQRSNDTYFYKVSQIIGQNALGDWAKKLYLGKKLGIDLSGEEEGLVPDDAWKQKTLKEVWYPGDTLHMSIGQGFVLTTPLQILGITSYVAVDGTLYQPNLLLSDKPKALISNLLPKEQLALIKKGLEQVPKEGGTAWPFFTFPINTAGKTGTAEYGDPKNERGSTLRYKTHAWYTSYAPADDPKIALTILIEGGGEGSTVASPIAKEIYRWYLSPDKNQLIKDINVPATQSGQTLGE